MSSSSDHTDSSSAEDSSKKTKNSWKIDLDTYSKFATKLNTTINDNSKCGDITAAYMGHLNTAYTQIPWIDDRAEYGIFPIHKLFYEHHRFDMENAQVSQVFKSGIYVRPTVKGAAIFKELSEDNKDYFTKNTYTWGDTKGTCMH